jgi:hypothetical protein
LILNNIKNNKLFKMTDYSNAVIYMIYCKDNNITPRYIGSSGQLEKRKQKHKGRCLNVNDISYNCYVYRFIRENGGWDNWEFRVLEEYPCDTKQQLEEREDYYIKQYNELLNSKRAKRTIEEWLRDTQEHRQEWSKEYYKINKEELLKKVKEYYKNNKEKKQIYNKKYKKENQERLDEKNKKIIKCECGVNYTYVHKARHFKSQRHQNYINNIDTTKQTHFKCECGGQYLRGRKNRHEKTKLHLDYINHNIKPKHKKIKCECGGQYIQYGKNRHAKSKKHLDYIKNNI